MVVLALDGGRWFKVGKKKRVWFMRKRVWSVHSLLKILQIPLFCVKRISKLYGFKEREEDFEFFFLCCYEGCCIVGVSERGLS